MSAAKTQREQVRCSYCNHVGPGRVPKGGDGSGLHPYPHSRWRVYSGGARWVPCGGHKMPGNKENPNAPD